jgi:hypothetical protein
MEENKTCSCDAAPAKTPVVGTTKKARNRLIIGLAIGLALWVFLYYWLQRAANYITYDVFKLTATSRLGSAVAFFLYDAPKVLLLLVIVVFAVGIVRSFFTPERTQRLLAGKKEAVGNVMAASLGIVTPFCSCSAVPLFIGFVEV